MAKLTKEQLQKINEKCENNWELDIEYFMFHNEKVLVKNIKLDNENYIRFKLDYNYNKQIILSFNKFTLSKNTNFATSNGLGKQKILDNTCYSRKSINNLIEYTKQLNDVELMEINKNTQVIKNCMFVESEDF